MLNFKKPLKSKTHLNTLFAVLLTIFRAESRCWTLCWLMLCWGQSVGGVLGEHSSQHKAWKMLFVTKDFTASPLSGHLCISRRTAGKSPDLPVFRHAAKVGFSGNRKVILGRPLPFVPLAALCRLQCRSSEIAIVSSQMCEWLVPTFRETWLVGEGVSQTGVQEVQNLYLNDRAWRPFIGRFSSDHLPEC